jgi:hypothetical protein
VDGSRKAPRREEIENEGYRVGRVPEWKSVEIDPALDPPVFAFAPAAGAHEVRWLPPPELPWPAVPHVLPRPN